MRKKLKVGILGCGAVAYRWYLSGLCHLNDFFELGAVCDINEIRAKQAATDFQVPFWTADMLKMLKSGIDVVVVLTRHSDHFKHVKFFLQNKVHVYSEKPITDSVLAARELIILAKKNNLKLGSAPQIMFSSRNRVVKEIIMEGRIGRITFIRASCSNLGPAGRKDTTYDPEWFYQAGGSLRSLGIYGLSALIWILGIPKKVFGFQGIAISEREVSYGPCAGKKFKVTAPDNVATLLDYGNGTVALFDGSYAVANPPQYDFEIHGTKGSLLVGGFGGKGSIIFKDLHGLGVEVGPDDDCHLKWNLSWGVEDLVMAVHEKREPRASADFAVSVLNVIEAIENSAKSGTAVYL